MSATDELQLQGDWDAQPLRDHELLELARREAFAIAQDPESSRGLLAQLEALSPAWQKRYRLALVG